MEHSVEFDLHEELVIHGREEKPGRMEYNITPAILTKSKEVCIFFDEGDSPEVVLCLPGSKLRYVHSVCGMAGRI